MNNLQRFMYSCIYMVSYSIGYLGSQRQRPFILRLGVRGSYLSNVRKRDSDY